MNKVRELELELARLNSEILKLKDWAEFEKENCLNGDGCDYQHGGYVMAGLMVENIERLIGESK